MPSESLAPPDFPAGPLRCPGCAASLSPAALLACVRGVWRGLRVIRAACPSCEELLEFRVVPGRLLVGYTYAAGAPHFMLEAVHSAPEVTGVWESAGSLHVRVESPGEPKREVVLPFGFDA